MRQRPRTQPSESDSRDFCPHAVGRGSPFQTAQQLFSPHELGWFGDSGDPVGKLTEHPNLAIGLLKLFLDDWQQVGQGTVLPAGHDLPPVANQALRHFEEVRQLSEALVGGCCESRVLYGVLPEFPDSRRHRIA